MIQLIQKRVLKTLSKQIVLLGVAAFTLAPQSSQADDALNISDIMECRAIETEAERLLCYDTVADGGIFDEQQLKQAEKEKFGSIKKQPELSADQIAVTIVRVQEGANRIHYFHTDSGEIWKQSSGARGNWNLDVPFNARIKKGVLRSFFLVTEGGKSTRVKRAQ